MTNLRYNVLYMPHILKLVTNRLTDGPACPLIEMGGRILYNSIKKRKRKNEESRKRELGNFVTVSRKVFLGNRCLRQSAALPLLRSYVIVWTLPVLFIHVFAPVIQFYSLVLPMWLY